MSIDDRQLCGGVLNGLMSSGGMKGQILGKYLHEIVVFLEILLWQGFEEKKAEENVYFNN